MYVAISENEIVICFSSFDDKQRFIIDGEEHPFQDDLSEGNYTGRISTIGREDGSLINIIEMLIRNEEIEFTGYITLHNGRLKMSKEEVSDLSLEEFLDADETSNNINFLSKISDTPDLSLCPEVIEPPTKPEQTLTVNDPERDFPTNPEPVERFRFCRFTNKTCTNINS